MGLAIILRSYAVLNFISSYSVNILYYDQWEFYGGLFSHRSWPELFVWQHGPHRMGIGYIFIRLIADATQWDSRAQDFFVGAILIFCGLLAVALKVQLTGTVGVLDVAIPLLLISLRQYEQLITVGDPSPSVLPLLLLLVFAFALQIHTLRLRYGALLGITFLMIYTGYGFFIGLLTPVVILLDLRRDPAQRLVKYAALAIAVFSLGSFFINWTPTSAAQCILVPTLLAYPAFAASMYGAVLGLPALHPISFLVAIGMLVSTVWLGVTAVRARSPGSELVLAVLSGFSLLYVTSTAVGRACMGPQQAQDSRYVTLVIPAFFALYVALCAIQRPRLRVVCTALFAAPVILFSAFDQHFFARGEEVLVGRTAWRDCYLRYEDIQRCTQESGYVLYPYPEATDMKLKLDYLRDHNLNLFKK